MSVPETTKSLLRSTETVWTPSNLVLALRSMVLTIGVPEVRHGTRLAHRRSYSSR